MLLPYLLIPTNNYDNWQMNCKQNSMLIFILARTTAILINFHEIYSTARMRIVAITNYNGRWWRQRRYGCNWALCAMQFSKTHANIRNWTTISWTPFVTFLLLRRWYREFFFNFFIVPQHQGGIAMNERIPNSVSMHLMLVLYN